MGDVVLLQKLALYYVLSHKKIRTLYFGILIQFDK